MNWPVDAAIRDDLNRLLGMLRAELAEPARDYRARKWLRQRIRYCESTLAAMQLGSRPSFRSIGTTVGEPE